MAWGAEAQGVPKRLCEKGKMRIPGNNFKKIDLYCL